MLQVVFCFSDFLEAFFTIPLEGSSTEGMCFSSSALSCVLAATLWVMGFFHSLFGNSAYNILPEQGSMGEYLLPQSRAQWGRSFFQSRAQWKKVLLSALEQSSTRDENSLSLGARLNEICSYECT